MRYVNLEDLDVDYEIILENYEKKCYDEEYGLDKSSFLRFVLYLSVADKFQIIFTSIFVI